MYYVPYKQTEKNNVRLFMFLFYCTYYITMIISYLFLLKNSITNNKKNR